MEPRTEKEDMKDSNTSFRGVIVNFMGYTTAHGFGRFVASKSLVWKIFWILAIVACFAMFAVEGRTLFQLYLSQPVQTSVSVTIDKVWTSSYKYSNRPLIGQRQRKYYLDTVFI